MKIVDWGLVEYTQACDQQAELLELVAEGKEEETLVFCTHPPVVTLGRATTAEDMDGWSGSTLQTSRGGRATYHGPSQIVIYPILDLNREHANFKPRDIHSYLRTLEDTTVMALKELGLTGAESRETPVGETLLTGVWNGPKKIASVGIAVRKWISYHGVAINILNDVTAHKGIRPCGFAPDVMTSLEAELNKKLDMDDVKSIFKKVFAKQLS